MLVTPVGIVTSVRPKQLLKEAVPMVVTGSPMMLLGMDTAPPGPVYPVIVTLPLVAV